MESVRYKRRICGMVRTLVREAKAPVDLKQK